MASFFLPFIDSINCKKLMDGKKLEREREREEELSSELLPAAKVFEFEDLQ